MKTEISAIDKNFNVEHGLNRDDIIFFDVTEGIFNVYGVFKENDFFRRMPETVAKTVNEGVYGLHTCTAGGRVRFVTDSPCIAVKAEIVPQKMPHFAFTGSIGFDLYSEYEGRERYDGTFVPSVDIVDNFESLVNSIVPGRRTVTVNMPLYSSLKSLYIGIKKGSVLESASEYKVGKPVVYYGSSITQGACASRPGNSYQSIISRRLSCDYINLGFSGSARGEKEMAEYISTLNMSAFVLDYDHNSPSIEHLEQTHANLFQIIRKAQPNLPIIILPRPNYYLEGTAHKRKEIVRKTYVDAKNNGDNNVYFIDNSELAALVGDGGTVDRAHPSDSGFLSMANAIGNVLEKILY